MKKDKNYFDLIQIMLQDLIKKLFDKIMIRIHDIQLLVKVRDRKCF